MKANVEGRTDPVVAADLADDEWVELRREHHAATRRLHKPLCSCVDCNNPLHPKQNDRGTRFFAHNPDAPDDCPLKSTDGESEAHRNTKLAIYRAVRRSRGWTAHLEESAPEVDPVTRKSVVVDVVARHHKTEGSWTLPVETPSIQGWEVQFSPQDEGQTLERQEVRSRHLRCTWVTRQRPTWANRVPWYELAPAGDAHPDLVVDGAVRWVENEDRSLGGDFELVPPFPGDDMVKYMLRGVRWEMEIGWRLDRAGDVRRGPVRARRESVGGVVAEYCSRQKRLPEYAQSWTDADWFMAAKAAYDRERHGERLGPIDLAAIERFPEFALDDPEGIAFDELAPYDQFTDRRPCLICGDIVAVSISNVYPVHHRCAWYVNRGLRSLAPA